MAMDADAGRARAEPTPRLTLADATCVVIGAIVGVGIFFGPRDVAGVAGSASGAMLAWCIGGGIALLGALVFAELGRMRPAVGGQYEIVREVYGAPPAFVYVFCNLTAVQAGAVAIIGIICAENVHVALRGVPPSPGWTLPASALLTWALALTNVFGVRPGANVQDATVALKLVALAGIVVLALVAEPAAARPTMTERLASAPGLTISALFAAVTITLFSYGGWQQVLWIAGEVRDARRNVPRATIIGVCVVVVVYLAANWAYLHLLGFEGVRDAKTLASEAVATVLPAAGSRLVAAAVAASAFGVLNAQFLTGPWLTFAMARDGRFFPAFGRLHPRFGTPHLAILLLALIATALTLGLGLQRTDLLTTGVVVVDAVFFALTALALVVLRRRASAAERGPAWLVPVAIAFAALELAAIAGSLLEKDVRVVALSALGFIGAAALLWLACFRHARTA